VSGLLGFATGIAILGLVWFAQSPAEWFIVSLIPGAIALNLPAVPYGYSPPRAFGFFAALWVALFWQPVGVAIGQQAGIIK
jgi:hypothetical protein